MRLDCGLSLQQEVGWDRQTLRTVRCLAEAQDQSFLVYSEGVLVEQIKEWRRMFPNIQPVHEVGYNSVGRLLERLREDNVRLDVSSKQQMTVLDDLALLNQDCDVVFNAAHKLGSHLRFARQAGVEKVVFNAREEVLKIKKYAPNARLILMLNCSEAPCNMAELKQLLLFAQEEVGLEVEGVYLDLATREEDRQRLEQWVRVARSLVDWAAARGSPLRSLHIGELTGVSFSDGFVGELSQLLATAFPAALQVSVSATASRFLLTPCITLAARIVAKRQLPKQTAIEYYINEGVFGAFAGNLCLEGGMALTPFPLGGGKGRKGKRSQLYCTRLLGSSGDELDVVQDDLCLPDFEVDDWLLFPGLGCINNAAFANHSNIPATANYVYTKALAEKAAAGGGSPTKMLDWTLDDDQHPCEEINLDQFEYDNLSSVLRGDWILEHTFLLRE